MWRLDSFDDPAEQSDLWGQPLPPTGQFAAEVSVGEPDVHPVNQAASSWDEWRAEIAHIGGRNPLIDFDDKPDTRIDLSHAHPGGLARFIAGSPTLLGNLIRDDLQRRDAYEAASRLLDHHIELFGSRGIDAVAMGIGVVSWRHEGRSFSGPLLLRPVSLRRRGSDIELTLQKKGIRLNPALQREFARQLELHLDADSFVRLTDDDGSFRPNAALDRLRDLTRHRDDVTVSARLVVSAFAEVAAPMLADAAELSHPILDALGGNPAARSRVQGSRVPVEVPDPDRRLPETDRLIVDADAEQDVIVAHLLAGNSMTIRTLPGTGATQTIVNALGALVAANRRVLVVSPRTASLEGIVDRLTRTGLPGMAVRVSQPRADLIRSISRNEKATLRDRRDVDQALVRLREVIGQYRAALSTPDPELRVSLMDAVTHLARLSLHDNPPETAARLGMVALRALATDRPKVASLLKEAADLGQFRFGPDDSPWYGVAFANQDEAQRAHKTAVRLSTDVLPRLIERATSVIEQTPLPRPTTFGQLALFVHLLADIRDSLDRFVPAVFDRSLAEVIVATGSGSVAESMPRLQRRRLKALAKEYIRPGMHVSDIHQALVGIQAQRHTWNRFVATGEPPSVPAGVADVQTVLSEAEQDIAWLSQILGRTSGDAFAEMPLTELQTLLAALAEKSDILQTLEERAHITGTLSEWELDPLVADLANRHVESSRIDQELELAWWRGCLEHLLAVHRDVVGHDPGMLQRLEADFRLVDEAHAAGNAERLAWQLAERWSVGVMDWEEEASWLKKALTSGAFTPRQLHQKAPHLARALAPVWLATPYQVHQLPDQAQFDVVMVVDAGAVTVAEVAPAIRRAGQVVALADPVTQRPEPFEVGLTHERPAPVDPEAWHMRSAFSQLATLLPGHQLTRSYRVTGEDLAEVIDRKFYGGEIQNFPWAGSFLGHPSVQVTVVEDGFGLPDPLTGVIESVDAEVKTVVDYVIDHALTRPHESLMVVTASAKHAKRVFEGVSREVHARPELGEFFTRHSAEPFLSVTLRQCHAESRDRVIFSLGYGRTPHGRVLSDVGMLSEPGAERLLAVAMTRARRHLRIVTCVEAQELLDERLDPSARALGLILRDIENPATLPEVSHDPDPMLVDLGKRLSARGLRVSLDHHGVIPLVASHNGVCVALDTDHSLMPLSIRESLRLRPHALTRLGWHYLRVHLLELFTDPDGVADRIARRVGVLAETATDQNMEQPVLQ